MYHQKNSNAIVLVQDFLGGSKYTNQTHTWYWTLGYFSNVLKNQ